MSSSNEHRCAADNFSALAARSFYCEEFPDELGRMNNEHPSSFSYGIYIAALEESSRSKSSIQ
jgi:hypothetical protein